MKQYQVRITEQAERDLEDIFDYIARHDNLENADYVLEQLEKRILALNSNPQRGNCPPELTRLGIKSFREIFFKPYRVIYEIEERKVVVHICADGRRDMQTLLERRLYR